MRLDMQASHANNQKVVRLLLEFNADYDWADAKGYTALMEAARDNHVDVVRQVRETVSGPPFCPATRSCRGAGAAGEATDRRKPLAPASARFGTLPLLAPRRFAAGCCGSVSYREQLVRAAL
jgi:ankyrin repeat protein